MSASSLGPSFGQGAKTALEQAGKAAAPILGAAGVGGAATVISGAATAIGGAATVVGGAVAGVAIAAAPVVVPIIAMVGLVKLVQKLDE
jgi:hypothetical protein